MSQPLVCISGVKKNYPGIGGDTLALDTLSLDIGEGQFVSVVGPSGCGKTTLMMMLAGLVPASEGQIAIDGQVVQRAYTDLGIVFQDANLLDWRSIMRNVLLQVEIRGCETPAAVQRARELLAMVGLSKFEDRLPHELSGGMRQRASICRALVHQPRLLLMDEPFGALDALSRDQLNLDLQDIWLAHRTTVLFVTHSISEAVFMSDRVIVMTPHPGGIAADFIIDLPRPRTMALRESPAFGAFTKRIRGVFEEHGILRREVAPVGSVP